MEEALPQAGGGQRRTSRTCGRRSIRTARGRRAPRRSSLASCPPTCLSEPRGGPSAAAGDGELSLKELAAYYGVDLNKAKNAPQEEMSDEKILEALQLQATLS